MGLRKKKTLLEQAEGYVEAAIDQAKEFVQDTARPALADAREKARTGTPRRRALADAQGEEKAAPVVAAGAAAVAAKATEAKGLAESKAAELNGSKPKKRSKIKTLLMLGAVGGAVAFVAKRLQGSSGDGAAGRRRTTPRRRRARPRRSRPRRSSRCPTRSRSRTRSRGARPDPLTDPLPEVEESKKS